MPKIVPLLAASLLAFAAAGACAQQIWKWRDAVGQLHISDTPPPPGTPAKNVVQRPDGLPALRDNAVNSAPASTPASASSPAAGGIDADLQKKKAKIEHDKADAVAAEKARIDKANAAARADNCRNAQQAARTMQSGQRITQINAQGEREFLDDAQIAAQGKKAQEAVAQNCGSPAP